MKLKEALATLGFKEETPMVEEIEKAYKRKKDELENNFEEQGKVITNAYDTIVESEQYKERFIRHCIQRIIRKYNLEKSKLIDIIKDVNNIS